MKHSFQKIFILVCSASLVFGAALKAMDSLSHGQLQVCLAEAIQAGDVDSMHELIGKGADVKESIHGWSMLHYAQCGSHLQVIFSGLAPVFQRKKLKGCDCRKNKDRSNEINFHQDVACRHSIIVKFLLEQGINPNSAAYDGTTALHFAAQSGCIAIARLLCQAGADVEARTMFGGTPLFSACNAVAPNRFALPKYECLGVAKMLIQEYNADITTVQTGNNPFLYLIKDATDPQGTPILDLFKTYQLQRTTMQSEVSSAEAQDILETH